MTSIIRTDLDLVNQLAPEIGDHYMHAVEFCEALPDYALLRFRDALDATCQYLAKRNGFSLQGQSLHDGVNLLTD